jgi:hypothetical protein
MAAQTRPSSRGLIIGIVGANDEAEGIARSLHTTAVFVKTR